MAVAKRRPVEGKKRGFLRERIGLRPIAKPSDLLQSSSTLIVNASLPGEFK
jgi:hypothetical protein